MPEFSRRQLMATSVAAALGASVSGAATAQEADADTRMAPSVDGEIERFAWTALGAEVTGPEVTAGGTLFFSLQHPARKNPAPFNKGGIGYVDGYSFYESDEFDPIGTPNTNEERSRVGVGNGDYRILAQEGDNIADNQDLGYPTTPDGLSLSEYPGSRYGNFGYNPDCNRFVPTNEEETEGYLFTNFEQSPGDVSRMPISRSDDGTWEADLENTRNLSNTEELRSIGGTRINCYGDISPWNTYLSAEEEYSHCRTAAYATVSDFVDDSEGPNRRGAAQFYNRPNPADISSAVGEYYGDDAWYVQGTFALAGVELLAYYLGADARDAPSDLSGDVDLETSLQPIEGPYPNPYRYGKIVDFRESASETPKPVKYHVMGRASFECPDVQGDERTVYLTSDGDNKALYKFVADQPIPSYDDPMDVAGTLHAAKVTNEAAANEGSPAEVSLEVEWLPMGHASNAEVESWIAEYDDVDQVDYLERHAETDWQEDLQAALEEADRTVVEEGNRSYVSDQEIVEWAAQYEANGHDGVDEDLRKVPFLETRAAAKEIDATVEFRKAEGIDSVDDSGPGDWVYIGISELNTGMADGPDDPTGDIDLDRVDGGVVYRAKLDEEYDLSTLHPVIVGPDATDPADVANDALVNIDNVFTLEDGRVICCEDADQYGRSYPNDCMYVYTPPEMLDDDDSDGDDGETTAYQIDFVAGEVERELGEGENDYYGRQERLIQYAHADGDGVTDRDTWINSLDEATRQAVTADPIEVGSDAVSVSFTVADGEELTLSLAAYTLPGGEFSFETADEQELVDSATGTFGAGEHTLAVDL